jgi:hypothetical protein
VVVSTRSVDPAALGIGSGVCKKVGRHPLDVDRCLWLRARVQQPEAETPKLGSEREILRRAAKYFAGETGW